MLVDLSDRAKADLRGIADYIKIDDPTRAVSFVDDLLEACAAIADFPRSHPRDPRFDREVRRKLHGRYHIIFEVSAERVFVLTIIHAARDPGALP